MPTKKRYSVVFVHGLAKKPAPERLEEIWRWRSCATIPRSEQDSIDVVGHRASRCC
jgi:hypothetical protein